MIIYFGALLLTFFLYIIFYKRGYKKIYFIIVFFVLTIISGCRDNSVGTDTQAYINLFLINNNLLSGFSTQELLFEYLCRFIGFFSTNPQWLLIICAGVTNLGVLHFIHCNSKNVELSVFFYIALYFYFFSMNGVRQFVAIGIVLIATEYAKRRKIIPFIILILLAVGFHSTAVLALVLWWIFNPKLGKKIYLFISIFLIGGLLLFGQIIPIIIRIFPRYKIYIDSSDVFQSGGVMAAVIYTAIFFAGICAAFDKRWLKSDFNSPILFLVGIASILSIATVSIAILRRVCWMFEIYSIVFIPNLLYSRFYYKIKNGLLLFLITSGIIYLLYCFSFNWSAVLPYRFA